MSIRELDIAPRGNQPRSTVGAVKGERLETGSDVFATLVWGLRRYVVLVLVMVLLLGVLVPLLLSRRTAEFQASAQVGPSGQLVLSNTNPLPRFAESVFNNGAVEEQIRTLLHQPKGNVIPSKVQLIAAQDNLVLEVQAHAPTAAQATEIANQAATTFVIELNRYQASVAPFLLQHRAVIAKKVPKFAGGYASVAFGLIAGLLAGVAVVGLMMVVRRPVVDRSTAGDITGSPVIGRITLPRHGPPHHGDNRSIGMLCRRLLGTSASDIHVAAPNHKQAQQVALSMMEAFGRMEPRRMPQKRSGGQANLRPVPKVSALDDSDAWMCTPEDKSYTVLLAPEGISTRKLRLFAEEHNTGAPTGVVLVSAHRVALKMPRKG